MKTAVNPLLLFVLFCFAALPSQAQVYQGAFPSSASRDGFVIQPGNISFQISSTEHMKLDSTGKLSVAQVCDEAGSNCKDVSGGWSSSATLDGLTDTNLTSPADNSFLRYDSATSKWVDSDINTLTGSTTVVAGFPDAIHCSGSASNVTLYRRYGSTYTSGFAAADLRVDFGSGTAVFSNTSGWTNFYTSCNGKSIATLYSEGRAFNFVGSSGDAFTLNEISNVSVPSPTNGQVLTWNSAGSNWQAADASAGSVTLDGLTDTNLTSPADNSLLRYDSASSKWVDVELQTGLGSTTVVTNWPDAINCKWDNSGTWRDWVFFLNTELSVPAGGKQYIVTGTASNYHIRFNAAGAWDSTSYGGTLQCSGKSIATLYSEGNAFNLVGSAADLWTSSGSGDVYHNSGNVGIGTSSPSAPLTVSGADGADMLKITAGANGRLSIGTDGSANVYMRSQNSVDLRLGAGSSDYLTVKNGGNVGIGTTNPSQRLEISVAGTVPQLRLTNSTAAKSWDFYSYNNGHLFLNNAGGTRFTVLDGGNVGIGTSSPQAQLDVRTAAANATIYSESINYHTIHAKTNSAGHVAVYGVSSDTNTYGSLGVSGAYGVHGYTISSGDIGVYAQSGLSGGHAFLGYNSGTAYYCYIGAVGNSINCNGPTSGVSDERLKKDIVPLPEENGLDAIMAITPVTYRWKNEKMNLEQKEMGFTAQNVEAVLPELVGEFQPPALPGEEAKEKRKNLQYERLAAPIVKAIQQLKAENDALRARIEALEAQ